MLTKINEKINRDLSEYERSIVSGKIKEVHKAITRKIVLEMYDLSTNKKYLEKEYPYCSSFGFIFTENVISYCDDIIKLL